jgi:hypothetical protein
MRLLSFFAHEVKLTVGRDRTHLLTHSAMTMPAPQPAREDGIEVRPIAEQPNSIGDVQHDRYRRLHCVASNAGPPDPSLR